VVVARALSAFAMLPREDLKALAAYLDSLE
jgi:hypothetical protein